jgi:hypothetical protein
MWHMVLDLLPQTRIVCVFFFCKAWAKLYDKKDKEVGDAGQKLIGTGWNTSPPEDT